MRPKLIENKGAKRIPRKSRLASRTKGSQSRKSG